MLCNPTPTPSTFPSFQAIDHPAGMGPFVSISEGLSRGIARVTHFVFLSFNRNSQNAPQSSHINISSSERAQAPQRGTYSIQAFLGVCP